MNTKKFGKSFCQNLLSVFVLGVFILLALGSEDNPRRTIVLANEDFETSVYYPNGNTTIYTGAQDEYGRWHGEIKIEYRKEGMAPMIEIVQMEQGSRFGEATIYHGDGKIEYKCYEYGWNVSCQKSANITVEYTSAFQILENKYPWYLFALNASGYSNSNIQAYQDKIEDLLTQNDFVESEFDSYYDDALDNLNDNLSDSITYVNSLISINLGLDLLKNSEFRMAVIDGYRAGETGTFSSIKTKYPNYLLSITDTELTESAIEGFCQVFDSIVTSYGALDLQDPFLLDSLDDRMYRAMEKITTEDKSAAIALLPLKSAIQKDTGNDFRNLKNKLSSALAKLLFNPDDKMVAAVIMSGMLLQISEADMIRQSVKEAWLNKKSIPRVPVLTTVYVGNNGSSIATFQGNILETGGADITKSGIVWSDFYNPTVVDQQVISGKGNESFSIQITGLTPGKTYYARTFATNSAGTVYGNCIGFKSQNSTWKNVIANNNKDLKVFPNPASAHATFSFQLKTPENISLTIFNLSGQEVLHKNLSVLQNGDHMISLNISSLENGIYTCRLTNKEKILGKANLFISR